MLWNVKALGSVNWKLLFKNIFENTCGWKNVLKCVKCCLKTENGCLKTQTKHPLTHFGTVALSCSCKTRKLVFLKQKYYRCWVSLFPKLPMVFSTPLCCCAAASVFYKDHQKKKKCLAQVQFNNKFPNPNTQKIYNKFPN